MSTLVLVRHGQASFGAADYDALSPLGQRQCAALGGYWQARGVTFDQAWSGTLRRQRESCAACLGREPMADARWNEYDADGITQHLAPQLAARDAAFAALHTAHLAAPKDPRAFQRMFEPLMLAWCGGLQHAKVEPWQAFEHRVASALDTLLQQPGSRRVAVFTSGGPIGLAVQRILQAPAAQALALNWRLRNSSLTTLLYSPTRVSLDAFNATPHLAPPDETFR